MWIVVDVSENYEDIEKALHDAEEETGPISMLVNCAGMAICGRLEDTSVEDIKVIFDLVSTGKHHRKWPCHLAVSLSV